MKEKEAVLYLLNLLIKRVSSTSVEELDGLSTEITVDDSYLKYKQMKIKINILKSKKGVWILNIELRQIRHVETHYNNNKNGVSWFLWYGNKEDIESGILNSIKTVDYLIKMYEHVYKYDLR